MTITVRPFAAGLGADIFGVDIREPLSIADRDAIRAAWLANLVLRFRGQPMTDEQHMAFTRQFGELEFNPAALIAKQYGVETQTAGRKHEIPPEISVISNIVEGGKAIGGLGDGEAFWHTDSSFVDVPPAASLLRALEVPPPDAGGATSFLNCYTAYDTLPAETKKRIDGLTMIHAATHSSAGKAHKGFENVDDVSQVPGARQPMVRTHPETGKKALFLGRRINAYVIGRPVAESEELLDELWAHTTQEDGLVVPVLQRLGADVHLKRFVFVQRVEIHSPKVGTRPSAEIPGDRLIGHFLESTASLVVGCRHGRPAMNDAMTLSQRADALEQKMSDELDYIVIKSRLYSMAEGDMGPAPNAGALMAKNPNARVLMGDDPRLPPMPEKPTLIDFFKYRFGPAAHLLQSAKHAVNAGLPENMVLACLLHDISTIGFIRGDHGERSSSSPMSMRK